jgi:glycosyltransferase involved in cell wall biosynthesis
MKILVVLPSLAGGGAERMHIYLANEWAKLGNDVYICVLKKDGVLTDLLDESVKQVSLDCSRIRDSFFSLLKLFRELRPNIIVPAMWPITSVAVIAKILSGIKAKVCLVEHCAYEDRFAELLGTPLFLIGISKTLTYIFADSIISVSKGVEKSIRAITLLPNQKFKVIYNGIPLKKSLHTDKQEIYKTNDTVVLAAGTLKQRKDFHTIINAIKLLLDKGQENIKLFILGNGPMKSHIENEISRLNLRNEVILLGFKKDVYPYMKAADLFVHSSEIEGFALVIAEALSCGTNVVSTDTPYGPSEILQSGKYGKLVPMANTELMADAIKYMLENPINSEVLRGRANSFSIKECAKLYLEEFK